ncbi:MAG TPA: hypothetical protein PLM20_09355 [Syntrophomonadaceae bacterium]|nr:hypothetical protein [Syntrophomonadaceae bacterium]
MLNYDYKSKRGIQAHPKQFIDALPRTSVNKVDRKDLCDREMNKQN